MTKKLKGTLIAGAVASTLVAALGMTVAAASGPAKPRPSDTVMALLEAQNTALNEILSKLGDIDAHIQTQQRRE
jgi:hypothetical protein